MPENKEETNKQNKKKSCIIFNPIGRIMMNRIQYYYNNTVAITIIYEYYYFVVYYTRMSMGPTCFSAEFRLLCKINNRTPFNVFYNRI
jgi:hypothetical protein